MERVARLASWQAVRWARITWTCGVCSGSLSPECEAGSGSCLPSPEGGEQSRLWCRDLKLSERVALGYCLEMKGISLIWGWGGGRSTRKRLALRRDKVFGQKVGAQTSCSGISSGREDDTVARSQLWWACTVRPRCLSVTLVCRGMFEVFGVAKWKKPTGLVMRGKGDWTGKEALKIV